MEYMYISMGKLIAGSVFALIGALFVFSLFMCKLGDCHTGFFAGQQIENPAVPEFYR
jgi:hypothetical protein